MPPSSRQNLLRILLAVYCLSKIDPTHATKTPHSSSPTGSSQNLPKHSRSASPPSGVSGPRQISPFAIASSSAPAAVVAPSTSRNSGPSSSTAQRGRRSLDPAASTQARNTTTGNKPSDSSPTDAESVKGYRNVIERKMEARTQTQPSSRRAGDTPTPRPQPSKSTSLSHKIERPGPSRTQSPPRPVDRLEPRDPPPSVNWFSGSSSGRHGARSPDVDLQPRHSQPSMSRAASPPHAPIHSRPQHGRFPTDPIQHWLTTGRVWKGPAPRNLDPASFRTTDTPLRRRHPAPSLAPSAFTNLVESCRATLHGCFRTSPRTSNPTTPHTRPMRDESSSNSSTPVAPSKSPSPARPAHEHRFRHPVTGQQHIPEPGQSPPVYKHESAFFDPNGEFLGDPSWGLRREGVTVEQKVGNPLQFEPEKVGKSHISRARMMEHETSDWNL